MIKDTPILIFDDSLSAVDTQTDAAIRNELEKMAGSMTMFLITQRVSSAQHADQILVLEDKKITQRGTHEELIQQEGLYQRIYEIQTSMQKVGD